MKLKLKLLVFTSLIWLNGIAQNTDLKFEDKIDEIFTKMELQGVNTNSEMLYGYFFYGNSKEQLTKLRKELLKDNYEMVRLDKSKEDESYLLHMQKTQIQSRETLKNTENQFRALANKYKIEYDGWDVGNKNPEKPITNRDKFIKHLTNLSESKLFTNALKLYNLSDYSNALIAFDICAQRKIKVDTSLFCLSNCLVEVGHIETGLATFKKVLEINPKYEKALFNIAAISYDLNKMDDAITYYKKVIEINPKRDAAYYGIAAIEYTKGNHKKSKEYCQKALEINPNNNLAQELLKWLK